MTRVGITGVGVVSSFGVGFAPLATGLHEGRTGVTSSIRCAFDASGMPTQLGAEVPLTGDPGEWLSKHCSPKWISTETRRDFERLGWLKDRKVAFGLMAACEALECANLNMPLCGPVRLEVGTGLERAFLEDFDPLLSSDGSIDWSREAPRDAALRYRSPVDIPTRALAMMFTGTDRVVTHASACAAATMAMGHAARAVAKGDARIAIAGGTDSMLNPLGLGGMFRLGALSAKSCRPFDLRRDGVVVGEGAAMFVLERISDAVARKAPILAEVSGYATSLDAYRATAPRPDGFAAAQAMQKAINRAGICANDIDYVNAHGTGTPLNDAAEAAALRTVFGARMQELPVSSVKGALGHNMAAAGALEIAACLPSFLEGWVPGTQNCTSPDPSLGLFVLTANMQLAANHVLKNSFGFGGQNASLVLSRNLADAAR